MDQPFTHLNRSAENRGVRDCEWDPTQNAWCVPFGQQGSRDHVFPLAHLSTITGSVPILFDCYSPVSAGEQRHTWR